MLWTLLPVTALMGVGSVVGAGTMALAGLAVGGVATAGFVAYKYPHLQHHFHPFGPRWQRPQHGQKGFSRQWTRNWRKGGSGSLKSPFRAGGRSRPAGLTGGRAGRRRAGAAFRSPGSGRRAGGLSRWSGRSGAALGRSRRGTGASRGLGTGRRRGSGRSRGLTRGSGRSRGLTRGSGRSRGLTRGSGRSRGLTRGSGRSRGAGGGSRRARFSPFRRGSAASRGAGRRAASQGTPGRRRLFRPSTWRRHGAASSRGRAGTGPRGRTRAGGGGRPSSPRPRRRLFRPSTWRRPRAGSGPRSSPRSRRRVTRPSTWFRCRNGRAGFVAGAGGTVRRRLLRPSTWRRPGAAAAGGGSPWFGRKPAGWRPGRVRRAWWAMAGSPAARAGRSHGRKLHRARVKAMRARRRAAFPPARRWFTPWRGRPGSHAKPGLRARYRRFKAAGGIRGAARARYRRYRLRHGRLVRPHSGLGWTRRHLGLRGRIARRWQMRRRVHRGLGITPRHRPVRLRLAQLRARVSGWRNRRRALGRLRGRPLTWRRRAVNAVTLSGLRRRRLTPPRPLAEIGWLAWARWPLRRLDQRRSARYLSQASAPGARHRAPALDPDARPAPAEEPGTGAPRPEAPLSAPVPGNGSGNRNRSPGGQEMDTAAMADEIRSQGAHDFSDPQDVHDTLADMHQLVEAMQDTLSQWAERLTETGVHQKYPEAVQEAANQMHGIADQLESVTAGGVMRGPG